MNRITVRVVHTVVAVIRCTERWMSQWTWTRYTRSEVYDMTEYETFIRVGVEFIGIVLIAVGAVLASALLVLVLYGFWLFVHQIKVEVHKRRMK